MFLTPQKRSRIKPYVFGTVHRSVPLPRAPPGVHFGGRDAAGIEFVLGGPFSGILLGAALGGRTLAHSSFVIALM